MNSSISWKLCMRFVACFLLSLLCLLPAQASDTANISADTASLLKAWEEIMASPDFIVDKSYLTDTGMITMSPENAVSIAIEMIKKIEMISADELAEYTPSLSFYVLAPLFPTIRSGYWEITLTPPEGSGLRPYFVEVSAQDPGMIRYDVLTPDGDVTKVLRQGPDGEIYEAVDLPGRDSSGEE